MGQAPPDPQRLRKFWTSNLLSVGLGVAMMIGGYFLCIGDHTSLGMSMFLAVPFVTGAVVAATVRKPMRSAGLCIAVVLLSLSILFFTGLEGIICVVMAFPLMVLGVYTGALVGYLVRGRIIDRLPDRSQTTALVLLAAILPVLVGAVDALEKPHRTIAQYERFTTTITLPISAAETWRHLTAIEPMTGPQPLLLRMGLPRPTSCELESQAVGARRVCHFDQGKIEQVVTQWDENKHMQVDVVQSTLPGRHWLGFHEAGYELVEVAGQTRLTRYTTISSRLYPRWYWRPLERWGVTSEHDYVMSNIARQAQTSR